MFHKGGGGGGGGGEEEEEEEEEDDDDDEEGYARFLSVSLASACYESTHAWAYS
jgi:hypothetical protein